MKGNDENKGNRLEVFVERIKRHPIFTVVFLVFILVTSSVQFYQSLKVISPWDLTLNNSNCEGYKNAVIALWLPGHDSWTYDLNLNSGTFSAVHPSGGYVDGNLSFECTKENFVFALPTAKNGAAQRCVSSAPVSTSGEISGTCDYTQKDKQHLFEGRLYRNS